MLTHTNLHSLLSLLAIANPAVIFILNGLADVTWQGD